MVASARLAALRSHACEPLRLEEPCQRLARAGHCGGSGGAATGPTARCSSAGLADVRRHERSRDKRQRGVVRARRGCGVSFRMRRSQTQHTPRNAGLRAFRAWRPRGLTRAAVQWPSEPSRSESTRSSRMRAARRTAARTSPPSRRRARCRRRRRRPRRAGCRAAARTPQGMASRAGSGACACALAARRRIDRSTPTTAASLTWAGTKCRLRRSHARMRA